MKKLMSVALVLAGLAGCEKSAEVAPMTVGIGKGEPISERQARSKAQYLSYQEGLSKFDETNQVVARVGIWELTMAELDQRAGRSHLRKLRSVYEERFRVLDTMLAAKVYEMEAKEQGITARELFERLVKSVEPSVDPATIAAMPIEERKGGVEQGLRDKIFKRHQEYVAELAVKHQLEMLMAEPESLLAAGDLDGAGEGEIVLGKASNAAFDVEVYTDYTCPYCKEVNGSVDRMVEEYGDRVRFIVRPMMNSERLGSRPAAVASYCVFRDNKHQFSAFSNRLFDSQDSLAAGEAGVQIIASQMGMSVEQFRECLSDEDIRASVIAGTQMAIERGIQNTPTVLIDGVPVIGNHDYGSYARVMEQVLSARSQSAMRPAG